MKEGRKGGAEPENGTARVGFYPCSIAASSVPTDTEFYVAIAVAFFGFMALAFILLFPIYRFIRKEERRSELWTQPAIAERQRRAIEQAQRAAARGDDAESDRAGGAGGDGTTASAGGEGGPGEPPELRP